MWRVVSGYLGIHGDDPNREDDLEERDGPKMDCTLQAAQACTATKGVRVGGHIIARCWSWEIMIGVIIIEQC